MSLSNAISNAMSGLAAAARGTEVVASNLANALTPGHARRDLQTSSRHATGGGVQVDGVTRVVRNSVIAQVRLASAEVARAETQSNFHKSVADAIGVPGDPGALTTLLSEFDAALVAASSHPESDPGLALVLAAAGDLVMAYNALGTQVQDERSAADAAIARDVEWMNAGLERVADLNREIARQAASGGDANSLEDERQRIIDSLAEIMPITEVSRDGGRVALFTINGGVLLDGSTPLRFAFTPVGTITPGMNVGSPPVGLLSVNGIEVPPAQMGKYAGGRLAANFQIRDSDGPLAQGRLDAAALDLHDRFADAGVDPSLGPTSPGLFTDAGMRAAGTPAPGLAQRLAMNSLADPANGGALWRLRDGFGAAAPGPVGNADLLIRMQTALDAARLPAAAAIGTIPRNASTMAADLTSVAASGRMRAEQDHSSAAVKTATYVDMLRQDGVDSDREMEMLLALERSYAANAKILQTVDEMIQTILRLT